MASTEPQVWHKGNFKNLHSQARRFVLDKKTGTGPIDILGLNKDKSDFLLLELKRDRASDFVVGQTLRYMGWVQEHLCSQAQSASGCIIARAQDERL